MKKYSQARIEVIKRLQELDSHYRDIFFAASKIRNSTDRSFVRQCLTESQLQLDDAMAWAEHRRT